VDNYRATRNQILQEGLKARPESQKGGKGTDMVGEKQKSFPSLLGKDARRKAAASLHPRGGPIDGCRGPKSQIRQTIKEALESGGNGEAARKARKKAGRIRS